MTYLAKQLAFPEISQFSELFGDVEQKKDRGLAGTAVISNWLHYSPDHKSEYREPKQIVLNYIRENMLPVGYDAIYFKAVDRGDKLLIIAQYNQIIGNRWLALVDKNSVPA